MGRGGRAFSVELQRCTLGRRPHCCAVSAPLLPLEGTGHRRGLGWSHSRPTSRLSHLFYLAALLGWLQVGGENGAGASRRPGGAAAGVWVGTTFPAPFSRPGLPPPAAGCPGRPLPRALLLPHPCAGLQSQETTSAELEGTV